MICIQLPMNNLSWTMWIFVIPAMFLFLLAFYQHTVGYGWQWQIKMSWWNCVATIVILSAVGPWEGAHGNVIFNVHNGTKDAPVFTTLGDELAPVMQSWVDWYFTGQDSTVYSYSHSFRVTTRAQTGNSAAAAIVKCLGPILRYDALQLFI